MQAAFFHIMKANSIYGVCVFFLTLTAKAKLYVQLKETFIPVLMALRFYCMGVQNFKFL